MEESLEVEKVTDSKADSKAEEREISEKAKDSQVKDLVERGIPDTEKETINHRDPSSSLPHSMGNVGYVGELDTQKRIARKLDWDTVECVTNAELRDTRGTCAPPKGEGKEPTAWRILVTGKVGHESGGILG